MDDEAMEVADLPDEVEYTATTEATREEPEDEAKDDAKADETDASTEADDEPGAAKDDDKPSESKAQRKRRMRREREIAQQGELERASKDIDRLKKRIAALTAPEYNQFDNPDDYIAERAAHAAQRRVLEADVERANEASQVAMSGVNAEKAQAISDALDEGRAAHADFEAVVRSPALALSQGMLDAAVEADNSPDVLYFLGKNPDETRRISSLGPVAQAVEIGRLSAKLSSPTKRQTSAPPPIKPVRGNSGKFEKTPGDMTYAEYSAWRAKSE